MDEYRTDANTLRSDSDSDTAQRIRENVGAQSSAGMGGGG